MQLKRDEEIVLAALLHDVGKVLQRTGASASGLGASNVDYQILLPRHKEGGQYSHYHALFTYLFLDKAREQGLLPALSGSFTAADQNLIQLAARHHNPSTPNEWIIAEADRISAGMDRKEYNEQGDEPERNHYITERLSPIFEEVSLGRNRFSDFRYRYPLAEMSAETLIPLEIKDEPDRYQVKAVQEYEALWEGFAKGFERLVDISTFPNYFEALSSLMERYFWSVPSATYSRGKKVWSDISLYDHLFTTAAFAHALFQYHIAKDSMAETSIKNHKEKKFLFITLDLSGIQDFIFDITVDAARGAARMIRARSFFLTLLIEGAFRLLCRHLGLTGASRLMDAGGRALILAPNLTQTEANLIKVRRELDQYCLDNFQGQITINLSWLSASAMDLQADSFDTFLGKVNLVSQNAKSRKLSDLIGSTNTHLRQAFWDEYQSDKGLCRACRKMQAVVAVQEETGAYYCPWCNRFAMIGRMLPSAQYLLYRSGEDAGGDSIAVPGGSFCLGRDRPRVIGSDDVVWCLKKDLFEPFAMRFAGSYVPRYREGDPVNRLLMDPQVSGNSTENIRDAEEGIKEQRIKSFHHIALSSLRPVNNGGWKGRPTLAVFKADVDNLGLLFGMGLRKIEVDGRDEPDQKQEKNENRLTVGRFSTMSRMLDRFFCIRLPALLAGSSKYADTYTVYAGGDDLFLIGPWRQTFDLAGLIYEEFRKWTCHNPDITISGTLSLMKARHPVNFVVRRAEDGLETAKHNPEKDRLHLWGEVFPWKLLPKIVDARDELDHLMNDPASKVSHGIVYDFLLLRKMRQKFMEERILRCGTYASVFRYHLGRLVRQKIPTNAKDILIRLYGEIVESGEPVHLAVPWALLLNRK